MIVNERIEHPVHDNHFIEFGISTWTQEQDEPNQTESIRRTVYNEDGKFSPHGSSEIPLEEMGFLFRECLRRDRVNIEEMIRVLSEISDSISRLTR